MPKIKKLRARNLCNTSSRTRRRIIQLENQDANFARSNSSESMITNNSESSPNFSTQLPLPTTLPMILTNNCNDNLISHNSFFETNINAFTVNSFNAVPIYNTESIENDVTNLNTIETIKTELKNWAVNCRISHCHINSLLVILRKYNGFEKLPKDARTLLQTPVVNFNQIRLVNPNGKYFHFGLTDSLLKYY